LAGSIGLIGHMGPMNTPAPPAAPALSGPPQSVHYAVAAYWDYLDGPRLESMVMCHRGGVCDEGNNLYFLTAFGLSALRCVRANGMVETITGDDRPLNDLGLTEGPAAFLPKLSAPGGFGSVAAWMSVRGTPWEGEEKGSVYVGASGGPAFRVFRSKAQGGRWWFKRMSFAELKAPFSVLAESGGELAVLCDGSYYRFDEAKGTLTLLLSAADYKDKWDETGRRWPLKGQAADNVVRAEDGTFYLSSWRSRTGMYRLSADKAKFEMIVAPRGNAGGKRAKGFDGSGMTADFFDGPSLAGYRPPHTLFVSAVDDGYLRRWRDGRISTWSEKDGEWHEFPKRPNVAWFYGWCMGPRGTNYAYDTYSGQCRAGDDRIFRIGPIDFDKATVGPQVEGK
jgi:hypothetical protein